MDESKTILTFIQYTRTFIHCVSLCTYMHSDIKLVDRLARFDIRIRIRIIKILLPLAKDVMKANFGTQTYNTLFVSKRHFITFLVIVRKMGEITENKTANCILSHFQIACLNTE